MKRDPNCYVCGDKQFTLEEQKQSLKDVKELTEGKTINELIEDLNEQEQKNNV